MSCPKCQGMVGREFIATYEGKCFMPYCVNCGWRPTRAPHRGFEQEARLRQQVLSIL
ncbi:hypothetical protein [Candidatus Manganitrophus noduliformans]|uniref:hypothetical protein n=1 Tax=Candidatus Manganitrophus noduliformans TaxID=2606439 RepID=UPI00143A648F|nr:hypothetical protein [Candidatus Manganitrophus noduliformans]